jgi:hypothetical protein
MATTGITALGKTLIGVEALAGASTDAVTTHWRGIGTLKDRREIVFPPQRVGRLGGTTRSYTPKTGAEIVLEDEATFEYLPYIFNAGIYAATGTTDASSGITRTWAVQSASSDPIVTTDLATLVIENGDNVDAEIARFCYVREWTLSGTQGQSVHISATLDGRAPSTATFTAVGATDFENPFETILTSMGTLYIDPSTDTAGTTQKTLTLIDFSLRHTTGWVPLAAKDGRTDFSDIKRIDDEMMLDVTFEHNSIAVAEKAAWRAETERVVRLKFEGSALATTDAGATYDKKTLILDCYGKWATFGAEGLEEVDGDNVYRGTLRVAYAQSGANKCSIVTVNELAALP